MELHLRFIGTINEGTYIPLLVGANFAAFAVGGVGSFLAGCIDQTGGAGTGTTALLLSRLIRRSRQASAAITAGNVGTTIGINSNLFIRFGALTSNLAIQALLSGIAGHYVGGLVANRICGGGSLNAAPPPHAEDANDGFDESEGQVWRPPSCPLILDLDGDGIELTSLENSEVYFDIDGDGFREKTGWLKSDDGLLVLDRNNDGYINDISELFGNQTTGGFTELQELDSNNDGQITVADTNFAQLQVWRDLDADGRSDVNELFTLSELNITKIDAVGNSVNITNEGHLIDETASFELADGTQREVANVWFNLDQLDSYYDHNSTFNPPVVLTEQILNLPDLRGYGNLPNLRIAMANDSTLLNLVQSFTDNVNSGDVAAARQLMRPIMYRWASVDGVDPIDNYPNADIDLQELRFLETFVGRSWNNTNPNATGGATVTNTYERLQGDLETRLLVQLSESPVTYNTIAEVYEFYGSLDEAVGLFEAVIAESQSSASETTDVRALALAQYIQQESGGKADWVLGNILDETLTGDDTDNKLYSLLGDDSLAGGEGKDIYYGGFGNDTLSEYSRSYGLDTLDGGTGDDYLSGAGGNDVYLFNKGYDSDTISDFVTIPQYARPARVGSGGEADTIIFGDDITRDNLTWDFNGVSLTFSLTDSPRDSLTIVNYVNSFYRIENIQVEDNQLTLNEIIGLQTWQDTSEANALSWSETPISFQGLAGDDNITTGDYNDTVWGNEGNDRLNTGNGDDTLDGGEGNDTLSAGNGNNYLVAGDGNDSLVAGSGEDTLYGQEGDDTLQGGDGNDVYYGGDGNDNLSEYNRSYGVDTLDGGEGNDFLSGAGNNDIYIFDKGYGSDTISDFVTIPQYARPAKLGSGGDSDAIIFGSGITRSNLTWNFDGLNLTFTLTDSSNDSLTIENYYNSFYRIENIEVEDSPLTIDEIFTYQTWQDTSETNSLNWLESSVSYKGLAGNDTITTGDYDDQIWGDAGNDLITSGDGNNTLYGGDGNDNLNAGSGDDTLNGGDGSDTLSAGNGINILYAENGNDSLISGSGEDTLYGQVGDDILKGGSGNDIYYGGDGNDLIEDIRQNYVWYTAYTNDSDTLKGGSGNDTLKGGGGDDLYVFNLGYGNDVILDHSYRGLAYSADPVSSGGANDKLVFGEGITRNNLRWNFDGDNLVFTLNNSPNDSLTIENYTDSIYKIENIEVDGNLLTNEEIFNPQFNESVTIGEFGRVDNFDHNSQTIELYNSYANPVVFALPLSRNGGDPSIVRITDIQNNSFTAYLQEAEYKDGKHTKESFSYLVLEEGDWQLSDGTLLEVGEVDTNKVTTNGWESLDFDVDFEQTPVILSQVQTNNGNQFVRTRQRQASVDGFRLSMEEEEALKNSCHATETVGWLAIESGTGDWGGLQYQAGHTGNLVNHRGYNLNFDADFDSEPHLFASLASYNGGDSSGLRYRNLNNTQVNIIVEEDQSLDSEIGHVNKIVDFLAISGTGDLTAIAIEPATLI